MAAPAGFVTIRELELDGGRFTVACKDDRRAIHIEVEGGPFTRGDAGRIAQGIALACDELPGMYQRAAQREGTRGV